MFFIATHSNHVLDTTLESSNTSIFRVEKEIKENEKVPNFKITYQDKNKEILDCLGVSASSVFLANGVIWVEGPSDVIYIEKWLKLYEEIHKEKRKFHKGLNYSFQTLQLASLSSEGQNIGFWDYVEQERGKDFAVSLRDVNHNFVVLIDRDDNFDIKQKPSEQKNSKSKFITDLLKSQNIDESVFVENYSGMYEATKGINKLHYFVNQQTIESYLSIFYDFNKNQNFKTKSVSDILVKDAKSDSFIIKKVKSRNMVSKPEFARFVCSDKLGTEPKDFFEKEEKLGDDGKEVWKGELFEFIDALYNTIADWNKI